MDERFRATSGRQRVYDVITFEHARAVENRLFEVARPVSIAVEDDLHSGLRGQRKIRKKLSPRPRYERNVRRRRIAPKEKRKSINRATEVS